MTVKLVGIEKPYEPKDTDVVECHEHGYKTTWGELDALQRLALEDGLDTVPHLPCILSKKN